MPIDPADPYAPRRRSLMPVLLLFVVALVIGMGAMAWLFHRYDQVAEAIHPVVPTVIAAPPIRRPAVVQIAPPPAAALVSSMVDDRIGKLEEQVNDIGQRAAAATGEADRAERLLLAFAARRAIDRGVNLGYLEALLRDRFGGVEPQAVATIISASREPVTVGQLRDQLETLAPQLSSESSNEGWWAAFRRELGGLIVVRQASVPSSAPVDRVARARTDLDLGQVDAALAEIARLPARKAADPWISAARRYVQVRVALDRIETAALLKPSVPPTE